MSARWRQQQDQQASFRNLSEHPGSTPAAARAPHTGRAAGAHGRPGLEGLTQASGGIGEEGRSASPGGRSLSPLGRIMFHAADRPAAETLVEGGAGGAGGAGEWQRRGKGKLQSDF
jgi:hypothetical protein